MGNGGVTLRDFQADPMFPRIERAVAAILAKGNVVAPVDVLVNMDMLAPNDLEDWRFGRVLYLERVIRGSLSRLSRLLRIVGFHFAMDSGSPSHRCRQAYSAVAPRDPSARLTGTIPASHRNLTRFPQAELTGIDLFCTSPPHADESPSPQGSGRVQK
jgi:hypothetical protein